MHFVIIGADVKPNFPLFPQSHLAFAESFECNWNGFSHTALDTSDSCASTGREVIKKLRCLCVMCHINVNNNIWWPYCFWNYSVSAKGNKFISTDDSHTIVSSVYFRWVRGSPYICSSSLWAWWMSSPHAQGNMEESGSRRSASGCGIHVFPTRSNLKLKHWEASVIAHRTGIQVDPKGQPFVMRHQAYWKIKTLVGELQSFT